MQVGAKIKILTAELESLILEWEKFFAGVRRVPPNNERDLLARRLRLLSEHQCRTAVNQFRLEQLQQRFMTYSQLWERQLRAREEGRSVGRPGRPAAAPAPNAGAPASVKGTGNDDLYERYVAAKRRLGQPVRMSREAFAAGIDRRLEALREELGPNVRLEVRVQDDKVVLAARARRRKDNGG